MRRWAWLVLLSGALTACSSDNAATCSSAIADGAKRLKDSALTSLSMRLDLGARKPYVVVIYPPFRSKADELLLDAIVPVPPRLAMVALSFHPRPRGFPTRWSSGNRAHWRPSALPFAQLPRHSPSWQSRRVTAPRRR